LHHAHRTVRFDKRAPSGPNIIGKWAYSAARHQCFKNIHLPGCIINVIVTPNDMRDFHVHIITTTVKL